MMDIGTRIRELRRKCDLTQEKLADYLGVSYQAVSKWETGVSSPDLSLIVPLAKLLHVTTDDLFGLTAAEPDKRREELDALYQATFTTGDTEERYRIAQTAAAEYPGDMEYLIQLAGSEDYYAVHGGDTAAHRQKYWGLAAKHYEMVFEDTTDESLKERAIYGLVLVLPHIGRREDAVKYARMHPDSDNLLMWCLTGEAWQKHRRHMIELKMCELCEVLEFGHRDLEGIKASEVVMKLIISDGNYLCFYDELMHNYIWQAACLTRDGRLDEAMEALRKSYDHAVRFEELRTGKTYQYTAPLLSGIEYNSQNLCISGTTTLIEDYHEYLTWKDFDPLREREDFKKLASV